MALKAKIDNLEGVDPAFHSLYAPAEDGSGFVLGVEGAEDVYAAGLKSNRDAILAEKQQLEEKIKKYNGVDPDEYIRLKQAQEAQEREKHQQEGNWQALEKQLVERHQADTQAKDTRIKALETALHSELVESKLTNAIANAKGVPELLIQPMKRAVQVVELEGGKFTTKVVDPATGQPRIGDTKGTPMSLDQLVEEFKANPVYGRAFEAPNNGGTGGAGGGNQVGAGNGFRITRAQSQDIQFYKKVSAEAAAAGQTVQIVD